MLRRATRKNKRKKLAKMNVQELRTFKKHLETHKQQQSKVYMHVCNKLRVQM
jgi:hypothetical protein